MTCESYLQRISPAMNASSIPTAPDLFQDSNSGSDSDANTDVAPPPAAEYYQPISSMDDDDGDDSTQSNSDDEHHRSYSRNVTENGISSLHLNGDVEQKMSSDDDDDDDDEQEEIIGEAIDSAISRAFREDEHRRNAPLSAENATRVREAMREISFGGSAPDWIGRVPEDQWINHLRSLRQTTAQSSDFR